MPSKDMLFGDDGRRSLKRGVDALGVEWPAR